MKIVPIILTCRNAESGAWSLDLLWMLDVGLWNFSPCPLWLCLPRRSKTKAGGENPDDELTQSRSINLLEPIVVKVNQGIIPKSTVDLGMRPFRLAGEASSNPNFFVFASPRLCVRFHPPQGFANHCKPSPAECSSTWVTVTPRDMGYTFHGCLGRKGRMRKGDLCSSRMPSGWLIK